MKSLNKHLHNLNLYFAGSTAVLIGLLNFKSGYGLEDLTIHAALTFAAVYIVIGGTIYLFKHTGILAAMSSGQEPEDAKGSTFDAVINDEMEIELGKNVVDSGANQGYSYLPGQIEPNIVARFEATENQ